MKVIRIHGYGGPEVLQYEDVVVPTPAAGELLIKVQAASVNPLDWKTRAGYLKGLFPHTLPFILGWDASRVVEAVGADVTKLKKGDEVHARTNRDGTYAEYAILTDTEAALKPKSVDHVSAAAIPLAALTAWQALFEKAQLAAGQKILIHGASGGVGSFAVQFAKWKGAHWETGRFRARKTGRRKCVPAGWSPTRSRVNCNRAHSRKDRAEGRLTTRFVQSLA
jgi:NADPH:quinone reductase-like Zn-dependent oxidoreductase